MAAYTKITLLFHDVNVGFKHFGTLFVKL